MAAANATQSARQKTEDDRWMGRALRLGRAAGRRGEVPVGAVIVRRGVVIGAGSNRNIGSRDPTAHAEIVALRQAARQLGNHRLDGARLFVTLEPCLMCLGAMVHARIDALVYGCADPKVGAVSAWGGRGRPAGLNHRFSTSGGVRGDECATLLKEFFKIRRAKSPAPSAS